MGRHSAPEPAPRPVSDPIPGDAPDHPAAPTQHRPASAPTPERLDPPAPGSAPTSASRSAAPPVSAPTSAPVFAPTSAPTPPSGWRERAVLAGAATITTGAVMAWAGAQLWATGASALGAGAVVLIASWVAATVPGPHRPAGQQGPEGSAAGQPDGHRPG